MHAPIAINVTSRVFVSTAGVSETTWTLATIAFLSAQTRSAAAKVQTSARGT